MFNFLKTRGIYLLAFLAVFVLVGNTSLMAQDQDVDSMWDDTGWELHEDDPWGGWEDDFWSDTTYDYDTTTDLTGAEAAAAIGIIMGIWGIIMLPLYIYFALTLMTIAKKLGLKNGWFAWIPILNVILMFQCAGLSPWLFLLIFVPLANIIILIYAYMKIAERRGFESWLGILMIVPIAQLIIPGYLAWGEPPKKAS
jgi:hypothetical protein